jgi:hypothetical protein
MPELLANPAYKVKDNMGTQAAVRELLGERSRIDRALQALGAVQTGGTSVSRPTPPSGGPGPKKPASNTKTANTNANAGGKRTFKMSDEAKEKIRSAQKARWAKIKKSMGPQKVGGKAA